MKNIVPGKAKSVAVSTNYKARRCPLEVPSRPYVAVFPFLKQQLSPSPHCYTHETLKELVYAELGSRAFLQTLVVQNLLRMLCSQ